MLFESNPLLSDYRKKFKTRHRFRVLIYVLIALCGIGWATNWYYSESVINALLTVFSIIYLLTSFPTRKSLLKQDAETPKYKVFAKILITECEHDIIRQHNHEEENLKELEEYLSKLSEDQKKDL